MLDSYLFSQPWTAEVEAEIKAWLTETYSQRENEEPDQEFLQYVLDMIKDGSTMGFIKTELMELGTDETTAGAFVSDMEEMLRNVGSKSAQASKTSTTAVSTSSQDALLAGPLKSGREGGNKKKPDNSEGASSSKEEGGARMLSSALQSSRFPSKQPQQERRRRDDHDSRDHDRDRDRDRGQKRHDQYSDDNAAAKRQRSQQQGFVPPRPPVDPSNPIAYFEEMNRIARESGFKNAQEMLASQKELMSLMSSGAPPMPGPMAPTLAIPGPYFGGPPMHMPPAPHEMYLPPQGYFPPPYPMADPGMRPFPRGGRGRFSMRGGRGGGRFSGRFGEQPPLPEGAAPTAPEGSQPPAPEGAPSDAATPAPPSVPPPTDSAAETSATAPAAAVPPAAQGNPSTGRGFEGRGGRGRGRFGRGAGRWSAEGNESAPHPKQVASTLNPFSTPFTSAQPAVANPFAAGGSAPAAPLSVDTHMGGRIGYSGRGRGRGRISPGNKTWVRPDLATAPAAPGDASDQR